MQKKIDVETTIINYYQLNPNGTLGELISTEVQANRALKNKILMRRIPDNLKMAHCKPSPRIISVLIPPAL